MKIANILTSIFLSSLVILSNSCKNTEKVLQSIYKNAMHSDQSYQALDYLCSQSPGRLPGTPQSEKAITFLQQTLIKHGADSVWLFPVTAPGWNEIKKPVVEIKLEDKQIIELEAVSLGECVSTESKGVDGPVVTLTNKEQIDSLGEAGLKGKIVFFNLKMKVRSDYGTMVWQRTQGASLVSKYGAVGVLVRSLTTKHDDKPHTGLVRYNENSPRIPAVAISWQSADSLERYLEMQPNLKAHIETYTINPGFIKSNNVIGEIKGSKYPEKILLLTGHLDAWHNAQGAQDDGCGIVQIVDVIRIFKELNIKPKNTIRVMPYMDEEQFLSGMKQYAEGLKNNNQVHLLDIEVDGGAGVPAGFQIQADSVDFMKQKTWRKYIEKNKLIITFSNSYATGWPLFASDSTILAHLFCKDDHYFDYHHSENDVFESIDKLNLQSGSAALAAFIYIIDKMEVIDPSKHTKQVK